MKPPRCPVAVRLLSANAGGADSHEALAAVDADARHVARDGPRRAGVARRSLDLPSAHQVGRFQGTRVKGRMKGTREKLRARLCYVP